jgi:hypothetical protein
VAVACLATGVGVSAQPADTSVLEDQLFAEARALLQQGRREIIADELRMSAVEAEAFWPVYEAYHGEIMAVRDRYADLIARYLRRYRNGDVSEEYAEDLLSDGLWFKAELLKIQKRYVRKFKKALPIRKAVRFYQLENKMDAEIDAQLAIAIPLMDPV